VSQPLPEVKVKKPDKHEAPKKTITTYHEPHVEKKKKPHKPGRKKVIEICAKNKTSFFALFLFIGTGEQKIIFRILLVNRILSQALLYKF
jgi:hypothetical protein